MSGEETLMGRIPEGVHEALGETEGCAILNQAALQKLTVLRTRQHFVDGFGHGPKRWESLDAAGPRVRIGELAGRYAAAALSEHSFMRMFIAARVLLHTGGEVRDWLAAGWGFDRLEARLYGAKSSLTLADISMLSRVSSQEMAAAVDLVERCRKLEAVAGCSPYETLQSVCAAAEALRAGQDR